MQNPEDIAGFKKEQMAAVIKSCELLEKNANTLKLVAQKLQKYSEDIIEHANNGDLTNQERNRELWHELNNVEHQLQQFSRYTEAYIQDFVTESKKLIEKLRSLRPTESS
jgi:hypothetical protein